MNKTHIRIRLFSTGSARDCGFRIDWSRRQKKLIFYCCRTRFGQMQFLRWQEN